MAEERSRKRQELLADTEAALDKIKARVGSGGLKTAGAIGVAVAGGSPHAWRVVAVSFVVALFAWGLGVYGPGVYLTSLHAAHGWPVTLISLAITAYYLRGAVGTLFVADLVHRFGPRAVVLARSAALTLVFSG